MANESVFNDKLTTVDTAVTILTFSFQGRRNFYIRNGGASDALFSVDGGDQFHFLAAAESRTLRDIYMKTSVQIKNADAGLDLTTIDGGYW